MAGVPRRVGVANESLLKGFAGLYSLGRVADEQIAVLRNLLSEEHCSFRGEFYAHEDIAFQPKAYDPDDPLPIWIGGEAKVAQRRAGRVGDSWFPYFPRITPEDLRAKYDTVRSRSAPRIGNRASVASARK
jgi:alkanesulfonate monooxygenase SsuD/methylene tetrahydromethanopterin reductase-like flavin-dependent oxidoreductase (luciferase family)